MPKRRVPKHALTLRDDNYAVYLGLNAAMHSAFHGDNPSACGVCGRPESENRRHDRDHDHRTGNSRGLTCVRCNRELLRNATLEEARMVVAYLERVEQFYALDLLREHADIRTVLFEVVEKVRESEKLSAALDASLGTDPTADNIRARFLTKRVAYEITLVFDAGAWKL